MSRFGDKQTNSVSKKLRGRLRDIIYTSQQNLYEVFKLGMTGQTLDLDGLRKITTDL